MDGRMCCVFFLLCFEEISSNFVTEETFNRTFESLENRLDNVSWQVSNFQNYDAEIWNRLKAYNTFVWNMSQILFPKVKRCNKASNTSMEQIETLTQKYEKLLEKCNALENKLKKLEQCPYGWYHFQTSCYMLFKLEIEWLHARDLCTFNHAKLVEYNDMNEVNFVLQLARTLHNWDNGDWTGFWVGANDVHQEGVFTWNASHTKINSRNGLQYWLPGQPDSISSDEDCMMTLVNKQGRWNDQRCRSKLYFLCEM